VVETANAAWSGPGSSGSCGIANPTTPASQPPNETGTRYTTNGGGTISVNCTLTASMSGYAPQPYQVLGGSAYVGYVASVSSVTINLVGTTPDGSGNLNILVGQGCTASLVGIPSTLLNNTAHPPTYSWTVSGTKFQDWGPSSPLYPNASYFIGGPGPLTNPTAHWYWNDPGPNPTPETVTCTATVTPPVGQGAPFTVTVTQKVTVQVPDWQAVELGGYMEVNTSAPKYSNYSLWAGPTASEAHNGFGGGMNWQAQAYTPTSPAFGTGMFELVQIVTPSDSYTTLTNPVQNHSDPLNGQTGLDVTYPYGVVWSEPAQLQDNDTPGLHLTGLGQSGNLTAASAMFQSSFADYLMYQPPSNGKGVKWVPLAAFSWGTNGNANIPYTNNWGDYVTQNLSDSAGTVTPSAVTPFNAWNTHPSWTNVDVSRAY